jgi:hypothetical protein
VLGRSQEGGVDQPPESLGYIPEAERFITDIASIEKNERDALFAKKQQQQYTKR